MEFGKTIANYIAGRIKGKRMVKRAVYNAALEVREACNNIDELEKIPPFTEEDCDDGDYRHCTIRLDDIEYVVNFDDVINHVINNINKISQEEVDILVKEKILKKLGFKKSQIAI